MGIFSLFRSRPPAPKPVQCPFCLHGTAASPGLKKCPNPGCGRELPHRYLKRYGEAPPLFLPMMGLSRAGKSSYLFGATVAAVNATNFWEGFDFYPLTDETDDFITRVRTALAEGRLPAATPTLAINDVYVLQLLNLARWGKRTWVIRDVPGEHFSRRTIPSEQVPFVRHATTAFLFFDFNRGDHEAAGNLQLEPAERTIDFILRAYVMGLEETGVEFHRGNGRQIVVVLTKADVLDLPRHLAEYLTNDEHWDRDRRRQLRAEPGGHFGDESMALYMERLRRVSAELRDWVKSQPGGQALLNAAQNNQLELHFCMISAIPCGVEKVGSAFVPRGRWQEPLRILDPFYWALELNSEPIP
jgi:hypothetical protein